MEELYKEYSYLVYNYLHKMCNDKSLAEELTQETFYKAIKSINKFNNQSKVSTWLCSIAKNTLIDYKRKHKENISLNDDRLINVEWINTIDNNIEEQLEKDKIYKIIDTFDPTVKEIFYLRLEYDLRFNEIGKILNKSEEWTRLAFYRGKLKIKEEMKDEKN